MPKSNQKSMLRGSLLPVLMKKHKDSDPFNITISEEENPAVLGLPSVESMRVYTTVAVSPKVAQLEESASTLQYLTIDGRKMKARPYGRQKNLFVIRGAAGFHMQLDNANNGVEHQPLNVPLSVPQTAAGHKDEEASAVSDLDSTAEENAFESETGKPKVTSPMMPSFVRQTTEIDCSTHVLILRLPGKEDLLEIHSSPTHRHPRATLVEATTRFLPTYLRHAKRSLVSNSPRFTLTALST